jgi:mannan endo-1,4-beta-mannosidase
VAVTVPDRKAPARGRWLGVTLLAIAAAGCGDDETPPPAPPTILPCTRRPPVVERVTREGTELRLAGQPFRVLGGNAYYLQQALTYGETSEAAKAQAVRALDDISCLSMNVVRTMGFNDTQDMASIRKSPGHYEEAGLRGLDRAVAEIKARGMRTILILTNNWPDFGGLPAYATWAGRAHDDFFSDATMLGYWKDYVTFLLARVNSLTGVAYKDEPAIFGWEISNELRCRACRGSSRYPDTIRVLAAHLKATGATQLILDGGEGFDDDADLYGGISTTYPVAGEEGASFSRVVRIPELDLVSYHLYPESYGFTAKDVQIWIDAHDRLAKAAGRLAYAGEFGSDPTMNDDIATRDRLRAAAYDAWLRRTYDTDRGSVALLWQVIPAMRRPSGDDGYGVVYGQDDRTARVLYDWARRVAPFDGQ